MKIYPHAAYAFLDTMPVRIAGAWRGLGAFQVCPGAPFHCLPPWMHDIYPLTPPAVSPPIRYLWNIMYKITTGNALTTAAPINWPYRGKAPPSLAELKACNCPAS